MDIIGVAKIIFLNFYYFDIKTAITKHPIKCAGNVKIEHLGRRGSVVVSDASHIGIGTKGSFALGDGKTTYWNIGPKGKVTVKGTVSICRGSQIIADGELEFGDRFYCNSNCIINSGKKITFDEDCLLGWNVSVMDGDGHEMGGHNSTNLSQLESMTGLHLRRWFLREAI